MSKSISFNSYDLQTSTVVTTDIQFLDVQKEVNIPNIGYSDQSVFIESFLSPKTVTIEGYIKDTTVSATEALLDTLKQNVVTNSISNLDIEYAGGTRRFQGICQSVKILDANSSFNVLNWEMDINLREHFGIATSSTTTSYTSVSSGSSTKTINFAGTLYPRPIYTITINTETDLTEILIKSVSNNTEIAVNRAFTAGDELIVNTETGNVLINSGYYDDWTGIFPIPTFGSNDILFTFVSTAHNVDIDVEYTARYL